MRILNKKLSLFVIIVLSLTSCHKKMAKKMDNYKPINQTESQKAFSLIKEGKFNEGTKIFYDMSQNGDSKAMITLGNIYYEVKEYDAAMAWYLSALKKKEPDSYNNIGVMYRDGLGVPKNRKIAYDLFLYTHMMGLGDEGTQMRANSNLRREVAELPSNQIGEALCYTWSYIIRYINARGNIKNIPKEVLPSKKGDSFRTRLKDANWWLDSEKQNMNFSCPKPWN